MQANYLRCHGSNRPRGMELAAELAPGARRPRVTGSYLAAPNSTWCTRDRTGFEPFPGDRNVDDRLTMWSLVTDSSSGRAISLKSAQVGSFRACLGQSAEPRTASFHFEGLVAGLSMRGAGTCIGSRTDFPEKGISQGSCMVAIRDLPSPYIGGLLTTNSLNSKAVLGSVSDPPGYGQVSIATIRLWK